MGSHVDQGRRFALPLARIARRFQRQNPEKTARIRSRVIPPSPAGRLPIRDRVLAHFSRTRYYKRSFRPSGVVENGAEWQCRRTRPLARIRNWSVQVAHIIEKAEPEFPV